MEDTTSSSGIHVEEISFSTTLIPAGDTTPPPNDLQPRDRSVDLTDDRIKDNSDVYGSPRTRRVLQYSRSIDRFFGARRSLRYNQSFDGRSWSRRRQYTRRADHGIPHLNVNEIESFFAPNKSPPRSPMSTRPSNLGVDESSGESCRRLPSQNADELGEIQNPSPSTEPSSPRPDRKAGRKRPLSPPPSEATSSSKKKSPWKRWFVHNIIKRHKRRKRLHPYYD